MQETWVQSLGQDNPLEKSMATHSSVFAWRIPWIEEPGRLQAIALQRVGQDWSDLGLVFLPGEFHGQSNLVGYSPWGRKELDTIEWLTLTDYD